MIDYFEGPVIEAADAAHHPQRARDLSRSFLYWMQTEAPRPDGGTGFPGLRLRGDVTGGPDGLAMAPYIRESRRIRAQYTVVEQDLSLAVRGQRGAVALSATRWASGCIGSTCIPRPVATHYIDVGASPVPDPARCPAAAAAHQPDRRGKNIGTTHITNGCYRLHPVEWNVGEVAGMLAAHCLDCGQASAQSP